MCKLIRFGFFIYRYFNLRGLLNTKVNLSKEEQWYYLTHNWLNKGFNTFFMCINQNVNAIAWLKFELAYFEATVQHFSHSHIVDSFAKSILFKTFTWNYIYIYI